MGGLELRGQVAIQCEMQPRQNDRTYAIPLSYATVCKLLVKYWLLEIQQFSSGLGSSVF